MTEVIKRKGRQIFWVYLSIIGVMWLVFLFNNVALSGILNTMAGINPREFSLWEMLPLALSWAFHANYQHLLGNTMCLLGLLFILCILEPHSPLTLCALIVTSALATWLLGQAHTSHIGASGLIFAIFGYIITNAIYHRKWHYILASLIFVGVYYRIFVYGLIPQSGVSFAAHFGGFIAGILDALVLHRFYSSGFFNTSNQKSAVKKFPK